jgi:DNA ligase 1
MRSGNLSSLNTWIQLSAWQFKCLLAALICALGLRAHAVELLLAKSADLQIDPSAYLVSEKLDGVRAIWDGQRLHFRSGHLVNAPAWFIARLPTTPLDGELWMGRGQFEALSAAVRRFPAHDDEWHRISYQIFELPGASGDFATRVAQMRKIIDTAKFSQLQLVDQRELTSNSELLAWLRRVTDQGGEGLMLHQKSALYQTGRSDALLKLKFAHDSEATVLGYLPGKGKYLGLVGSLRVRSDDGVEFRLGSGLKDADRKNPPAIGTRVTYRFRGLTRHGKPRFATFWRVRIEP